MPKVVVNTCFGGFSLSNAAFKLYLEYSGSSAEYSGEIKRDDAHLVRIVEELREDSWGSFAELAIVEIPDGVDWYIAEYDGAESVHENHRVWTPDGERPPAMSDIN